MVDSDEQRIIYCLVFDYCDFPIRPQNYVHFFDRLGLKYAIRAVSLQTSKRIKDTKFQNRFFRDDGLPETLEYDAELLLTDLLDFPKIDILCISGGPGSRQILGDSSSISTIKQVIDKTNWVVTEALGSVFIAATGLLDDKRASVTRYGLAEARQQYPAVKWETGPFFRPHGKIVREGKFIMSDNLGRIAPSEEVSAAVAAAQFFTALVERSEESLEPSTMPSVPPSSSEPTQDMSITNATVEGLANAIKREREDLQIFRLAEEFALRLACDGYIDYCNSVITELLSYKPDGLNFLVKRGLEILWNTVGPRPETPYPPPTEAELVEMEKEQRYYDLHERKPTLITNLGQAPFDQLAPDQVGALATAFAAVRHFREKKLISRVELGVGAYATSYDEGPITMPTEEEERRGLEAFKNYISRRDEDDTPLKKKLLLVYVNLAFKYGSEDEGKLWLDLLLRQVGSDWISLASLAVGRCTAMQLGNGGFRNVTGATLDTARYAAQEIVGALRDRWQKGEEKPFASLAWPDLLRSIQDASRTAEKGGTRDSEPYLGVAATEQAILTAEERLGVRLPDDYKAFLRLTNGTGPSNNKIGEPPLAAVEEISWDTETPRYAMLKIEPLPRVTGEEWSKLPSLTRALRISVDGWEEYVYLIEPAQVAQLPGQASAVQQGRWMASTWAAWRADHDPYESFRDYVERLRGAC